MKTLLLWLSIILICVGPLYAEDVQLRGHVKTQSTYSDHRGSSIADSIAHNDYWSQSFDARLHAEWSPTHWAFELDGEALSSLSDGGALFAATRNALGANLSSRRVPTDERRFADMTADLSTSDRVHTVLRLDRLAARYSSDAATIKLGRQAITWGGGLVFSVFDLFNPFSPTEIDKDYKVGDDMIYGQYVFSDGSDFQLLSVFRRDDDRNLDQEVNSFAGKYLGRVDDLALEYNLLLAHHYGETLGGLGLSKDLAGALVRGDLTLTHLDSGEDVLNGLLNIDRSWVLFEKNIYAFLEYFYSGVGQAAGTVTAIDTELAERIARGELFTVGRDYMATGGRVEWTPLLNMYLNLILNLHDDSGISQLRFEYDLFQDFTITTGLNLPFGARGTEFGGVFVGQQELVADAPKSGYVRLNYYY